VNDFNVFFFKSKICLSFNDAMPVSSVSLDNN